MAKSKQLTEKEQLQLELDQATNLAALYSTEGGKTLVNGLMTDVVALTEQLATGFRVLAEPEMRALCAEMKSKLDLARALTRAESNKEYLDGLLKDSLTT